MGAAGNVAYAFLYMLYTCLFAALTLMQLDIEKSFQIQRTIHDILTENPWSAWDFIPGIEDGEDVYGFYNTAFLKALFGDKDNPFYQSQYNATEFEETEFTDEGSPFPTVGIYNILVGGQISLKRWDTFPQETSRPLLQKNYSKIVHARVISETDIDEVNLSQERENRTTWMGPASKTIYKYQHSGGFRQKGGYVLMVDFKDGERSARQIYKKLFDDGWFNYQMQSITTELLFYNPNIATFCFFSLTWVHNAAGHFSFKSDSSFFSLEQYDLAGTFGQERRRQLAIEVIVLSLYLYFLFVEIFKIAKNGISVWLSGGFYRVVDVLQLTLNGVYFGLHIYSIASPGFFSLALPLHIDASNPQSVPWEYTEMQRRAILQEALARLRAVNLFVMFGRTVSIISEISPSTGAVVGIMAAGAWNFVWFTLLMMVFFGGFAFAFYLLFGGRSSAFATFDRSALSCFEFLLGRSPLEDMRTADPIMGEIMFYVFIIVFVFILLNTFLSIILSAYDAYEQKTKRDKAEAEQAAASDSKGKVSQDKQVLNDLAGPIREWVLSTCRACKKNLSRGQQKKISQTKKTLRAHSRIGQASPHQALSTAGPLGGNKEDGPEQSHITTEEMKEWRVKAKKIEGRRQVNLDIFSWKEKKISWQFLRVAAMLILLSFSLIFTRRSEVVFQMNQMFLESVKEPSWTQDLMVGADPLMYSYLTLYQNGTEAGSNFEFWEKPQYLDNVTSNSEVYGWSSLAIGDQMYAVSETLIGPNDRSALTPQEIAAGNISDTVDINVVYTQNIGFLPRGFVRLTVRPACFETLKGRFSTIAPVILSEPAIDCTTTRCSCTDTLLYNLTELDVLPEANRLYRRDSDGSYSGLGGFAVNLGKSQAEAHATLQALKHAGIFTWRTRDLAFEWVLYNGNFDVFEHAAVAFATFGTGYIKKHALDNTFTLNFFSGGGESAFIRNSLIYVNIAFCVLIVFEIIFIFKDLTDNFYVYWVEAVDKEATKAQKDGYIWLINARQRRAHWSLDWFARDPWNVSDVVTVVLNVTVILMFASILMGEYMQSYNWFAWRISEEAFRALPDPQEVAVQTHVIDRIAAVGQSETLMLFFGGVNTFLVSIRVLKHLQSQPWVRAQKEVVKQSTAEILIMLVMQTILMLGFVLLFHIIFGRQAQDFSAFFVAFMTLFKLNIGDYDPEAILLADKTAAVACFVIYVLFFRFIVTNVFLATIVIKYFNVTQNLKAEAEEKAEKKLAAAGEQEGPPDGRSPSTLGRGPDATNLHTGKSSNKEGHFHLTPGARRSRVESPRSSAFSSDFENEGGKRQSATERHLSSHLAGNGGKGGEEGPPTMSQKVTGGLASFWKGFSSCLGLQPISKEEIQKHYERQRKKIETEMFKVEDNFPLEEMWLNELVDQFCKIEGGPKLLRAVFESQIEMERTKTVDWNEENRSEDLNKRVALWFEAKMALPSLRRHLEWVHREGHEALREVRKRNILFKNYAETLQDEIRETRNQIEQLDQSIGSKMKWAEAVCYNDDDEAKAVKRALDETLSLKDRSVAAGIASVSVREGGDARSRRSSRAPSIVESSGGSPSALRRGSLAASLTGKASSQSILFSEESPTKQGGHQKSSLPTRLSGSGKMKIDLSPSRLEQKRLTSPETDSDSN